MRPRFSLFDPRGTKIAYLIMAAIGMLVFTLLFFSFVDWLMLNYGELVQGVDTTLMLGIFLGALAIGFAMALIAKDGRGVTYGLYAGLAGLIVVVLMTWRSGILAALVGAVAILGGYNGGSLGEGYRRVRDKNRSGAPKDY